MNPKFPLSYSSINKFKSCPLSYYYKTSGVKAGFTPEVFLKGRERHTLLHKFGLLIKNGYTILAAKEEAKRMVSPKYSSISREFDRAAPRLIYDDNSFLEKRITVNKEFSGGGNHFVGILDYIRIDEDGNSASIVDYKGAALFPSYDLQAMLYAGLAAAKFGVKKITVRLFMVPRNMYAKDVLVINAEEAMEFGQNFTKQAVDDIRGLDVKSLHPVVGSECSICAYKHECPAMKSAINMIGKKDLHEMSKNELIALKTLYSSELEKIKALIGTGVVERKKGDKIEDVKDVVEFLDRFGIDAMDESVVRVDDREFRRVLKDYKLGAVYEKRKNKAK